MELLQLRYFCDAARSENFSRTAKKFMVPPSNISQSIKRLERELNAELFDRKTNSITLNERGKDFYQKISSAIALIDEAKDGLCKNESRERIRICVNAGRRIVMQAVEKFNRLYPWVEICAEYSTDAGDIDFDLVITGKMLNYPHLSGERLATEDICLAVPENSRIAALERVELSDLKDESFVAMGDKSDLHEFTKAICAEAGFEPKVSVQGNDPYYVRKCVEMGLGISLVPMLSWKGQFSDNVIIKPIGKYKRDTYVFKNVKKQAPKYGAAFLETLLDEFEEEAK